MPVECKVECDNCGEVVFVTVLHPFEIDEEIPCPVCGAFPCIVVYKEYIGECEPGVKSPLKKVEYGKKGYEREEY